MTRPRPDQQPTPTNGEPWPPPAELAKYENAAERRKRIVMGVTLLVAGIAVGLLAHTVGNLLMARQGEPQHSSNAQTMIVRSCEQYGPISGAGLGYWWKCTADEADGSDVVRTNRSELTANDIGKTVGIYGESSGYSRSTHYYRDVEHPLYGLGMAVACIGFFAVLGFLGGAFMRLVPQAIRLDADHKRAGRLREQYRHEGRL